MGGEQPTAGIYCSVVLYGFKVRGGGVIRITKRCMLYQKGKQNICSLLRGAIYCRQATVEAVTKLSCLTLKRDTFVEILGPLEKIMAREKSPQVHSQIQRWKHSVT